MRYFMSRNSIWCLFSCPHKMIHIILTCQATTQMIVSMREPTTNLFSLNCLFLIIQNSFRKKKEKFIQTPHFYSNQESIIIQNMFWNIKIWSYIVFYMIFLIWIVSEMLKSNEKYGPNYELNHFAISKNDQRCQFHLTLW